MPSENRFENNNRKRSDLIWIYGKHSVFNIIKKRRRKIHQILLTKNSLKDFNLFINNNNIKHVVNSQIKIVDSNYIEKVVGKNTVNQSMVICCDSIPLKSQNDLISHLEKIENKPRNILIMDQINDPHNVGAIIRSAAAFGIKNIVMSEYNFSKETSIIHKSSAGTIEDVNIYSVININNLIEKLKKINYVVIGLDGSSEKLVREFRGENNIAIIVGSEGSGIRALVKKNCSFLVKIPMENQIESLNASVAAAIALYEIKG